MSKCFLRMTKGHNLADIAGIMKHNFRKAKVDNADPSRSHLNKVLVALPEGVSYKAALQKRLDESDAYKGIKRPRKDAVRYIDVMMSVTECRPEDFHDVDEWAKANVKWLEDTFGKENVATAVLHMDESSPHIHALIIPMKDGRLQGSKMVGGIPAMRTKQNSYAEAMKQFGLERGVPYSKAIHEDIQAFYGRLDKYKDLGCPMPMDKETPKQERNESDKDYAQRIDRWHKQHYKDYSKAVDTWYHGVMQKAYLKAMGEIERLRKAGFDVHNIAQSHTRLVNDWGQLYEAQHRLERAENDIRERITTAVEEDAKARYRDELEQAKKAREAAEQSRQKYAEVYNTMSAIMHSLRHNLMSDACEYNGEKTTEGELMWKLMQESARRGYADRMAELQREAKDSHIENEQPTESVTDTK